MVEGEQKQTYHGSKEDVDSDEMATPNEDQESEKLSRDGKFLLPVHPQICRGCVTTHRAHEEKCNVCVEAMSTGSF